MRSSLEQMERIAQYLSGTLSPEERAGFEAEVDGDPVLREQLDFQRDMDRVIQRRALRSEINTVAKQYGASSGFSWMVMAVSGIVVVAGVAGFLLFSSGKEPQARTQQLQHTPTAAPVSALMTDDAAAAVSDSVSAPARQAMSFRLGLDRFEHHFVGSSLANVGSDQLASGRTENATHPYRFISDPEQLDLLPEGFYSEALAQLPVSERREWNRQRLNELYYSLGSMPAAVDKGDLGYIAVRSWRKPVKMRIPVGMMKRSDYKSRAFGRVVDEKGDGLKNVEIAFLAYGDKRIVTTDAEGHFSFEMYGRIVTEATFSVPGYGSTIMPKAQFQAGRQTWFQVELPVPGLKEKKEGAIDRVGQTEEIAASGSCSISPAAVKALYAPEFIGTYIATKEFEKRIKALHVLGNGQELLDVYVDNLTQPLWKVDQLVADRLTGESKKLFEGFGAERSESSITGLKDQAWYSTRYRDGRRAAEQESEAPANAEKALMEHMRQFVAPCAGEPKSNTQTKEETEMPGNR